MQNVFADEIKIIAGIPAIIDETIKRTVQENDFVIKEYNITKQLDEQGEDAKGKKIKPGYSNPYKRTRIKRGLQVEYVDTHFTGKFHAQLEIVAENGQFKIVSKLDYAEHVIKRYGKRILGIQQQYLADFVNDFLLPELKKAINGQLTKS
ncbi:MAG TPA: hypothetical protein VFM82_12210 [Flavobacteriaceae bacterium]|nr:hypothetical protein [Flavobacteriaceae bacterium]